MSTFFSRPLPWILILAFCSVIKAVDLSQPPLENSDIGKYPYEAYRLTPAPSQDMRHPSMAPILHDGSSIYVYRDKKSPLNRYIPSGWMGDYADLQMNDSSMSNPAGGATCLRITYQGKGAQGYDWAGMYWQYPSNNWGGAAGGYNLQHMRRITFWARGEHGGEIVSVFKVGGIQGVYADTDEAQIGPITLTREWKQYSIDLTDMDLSRIAGGFAWAAGRFDNPGPITFYLDEIRYET